MHIIKWKKTSEKVTYCMYFGRGKIMERVKRSVVAKCLEGRGRDEQKEYSEFLRQWNYSVWYISLYICQTL